MSESRNLTSLLSWGRFRRDLRVVIDGSVPYAKSYLVFPILAVLIMAMAHPPWDAWRDFVWLALRGIMGVYIPSLIWGYAIVAFLKPLARSIAAAAVIGFLAVSVLVATGYWWVLPRSEFPSALLPGVITCLALGSLPGMFIWKVSRVTHGRRWW